MSITPFEKSGIKTKKTMTSLDLFAWLHETRKILVTSRINNVYRVDNAPQVFLLKIHTREGTKFLLLEPAARVHFTEYRLPVPSQPDGVTMAFRRHIRGAIIKEVEQVGFDRILTIVLSNGNKIMLELLPRGVLAVTSEQGKLLVSSEYKEMKDRVIKPGKEYRLPPHVTQRPTVEKCKESLEKGAQSIVKELGVPMELVREASHRASDTGEAVCEELIKLIEESKRSKGYLVRNVETGDYVFFSPYKPTLIYSLNEQQYVYVVEEKSSFNEALDTYFSKGLALRLGEEKARVEKEEKNRLETRLEKEERLVEEYLRKSEQYYRNAELLMKYRYMLEEVLECVNIVRKKEGWSRVKEECRNIVEVKPSEGRVLVSLEPGVIIELMVNKPVKHQITDYYDKAKKLRKKAESARRHLETLKEKMVEKERQALKISHIVHSSVRKVEWYEKYWWSITRNGYLVVAGKDASQNESLVKKYLGSKDIFLHADIHGAPATILKTASGNEVDMDDIEDAAVIAASYSKAWKEGLAAIDVFWVRGEQVSKTPPAGEYLPKGSFMIYGKKNFVKKVQLYLAVGVQEWGDGLRYLVGSTASVSKHAVFLGIIAPGETDKEKAARKIVEKAWSKGIQTPPPSELAGLLPGRSRIVKLL